MTLDNSSLGIIQTQIASLATILTAEGAVDPSNRLINSENIVTINANLLLFLRYQASIVPVPLES